MPRNFSSEFDYIIAPTSINYVNEMTRKDITNEYSESATLDADETAQYSSDNKDDPDASSTLSDGILKPAEEMSDDLTRHAQRKMTHCTA